MQRQTVDHYGATYDRFASQVYAEIRAEAFGEDIGQTGWLTAPEQDLFLSWRQLSEGPFVCRANVSTTAKVMSS